MNKNLLAKSIALVLVCIASNAHAETTTNDNNETCIASSENECGPTSTLDTITIVANKTETSMTDYAGQVSILDEDDLGKDNNIIQNMSQIPGVDFGMDFGRQIGAQYTIRGYGYRSAERVIIEQDGVKRDPSLFSNHISSFRTDPKLLKQVEVVKGGSSVVHGSGAIGGIVSMKMKEANDFINKGKDFGITMGSRYDSNNSNNIYVALAADPANAAIDFLAYHKKAQFDDIKLAGNGANDTKEVSNDEKINTTFIKFGWDINDEHRASISYYDYDENLNTSWQTLWHLEVDEEDPVKGDLQQKDIVFNHSYVPTSNDWINLDTKLYKSDASYYRSWTDDDSGTGRDVNNYENMDERWGVSVKNNSQFSIGKTDNNLVVGIDYENIDIDAFMLIKDKKIDFGSATPSFQKNLGLYIQNQIDIGKFNATLGARYDNFDRGGKDTKYRETNISPKVSIGYEVLDGVHLVGGYAETFRAPKPTEVASNGPMNPHYWYQPNKNLKPELSKEYEVGFAIDKQSIFAENDELFVKATYFDGGIDDMINLTTNPGKPPKYDENDDRRKYASYKNIKETERSGAELEGQYRMGEWSFGTGFDYIKIKDKKTDKLVQPSTKKAYTNFGYDDNDTGLGLGMKVTHWLKPKRDSYEFVNRGETSQYVKDDFTIVDVNAHWNPVSTGIDFVDEGMNLSFGINNLLNDKRINPKRLETTTAVGAGRNFYIGIDKTF